ncbi:MAG: thiolase family protein [Candidatus Aminicenantes bacterium]|nr:MAG: thiolase family protein [Candidatus Aminicenantes bacterium]
MNDVYVAGVSLTPFGKDFRPIGVILADACQKALQDSSPFVSNTVPDCLVIGSMDPIGFARQTGLDSLVGMELGLRRDTEIYHVELGSATGAAAVELGKRLTSSGLKVLVCFGEKMKGKLKNEEIPSQISTVIAEEERERGLGEMPAVAALASYEYMDAYKVSEKDFRKACFEMGRQSLEFGSLNNYAYFRQPISWEDYKNPDINRFIAKPLTKFDCSGSYNGAGAVYLIPDQTDIKLTSVKSAFDHIKIAERKTLIYLESAVIAGRRAYQEAELNPSDIDLCELHDAFKPVPWIAAEDLGFAERGQGHKFVILESNKAGKKVYINRSGGFLSRTHPLGASGGAQLVELVWQMRGHDQYKEMFGKDIKNLDYGLWFNMSGFGNTSIVGIIERTKPFRPRQDFNAENLPQAIPETFISKKTPRKDRIVAATQYKPPGEEEEVNVAIVQTKEGDFRIGLAQDPHGVKRGKYIKWIQPEDGPYFIKEGYVKGRLSDLFRIFRREKSKGD